MKTFIISFLCILPFANLSAEERQQYWVSPFSYIAITWKDDGKVHVVAISGAGKKAYTANLKKTGDSVYQSSDGVNFSIKKLEKPETIDEGPDYTFKSNRQLTITGKGDAFEKIYRTFVDPSEDRKPQTMVFYHDEHEMIRIENVE